MQRVAARMVTGVSMSGEAPAGPGTLYVSNHISWLDIPVLGSIVETDFIAKAEVVKWPVIGPLSRRTGTLFVDREERRRVHQQADAIANRLAQGHSLVLFPEGTTSDGVDLLPFRTSLFEAAQGAARIQPLALGYHRGDGRRFGDDEMRRVGWTGAEPLGTNLARVTGMSLAAEVRFAASFAPEPRMTRKKLADQCRAAVLEAYQAIRDGR